MADHIPCASIKKMSENFGLSLEAIQKLFYFTKSKNRNMKNAVSSSVKVVLPFLLLAFLVSCGGLKDQSNSKLIQKRKYTKGYQVNVKLPKVFDSKERFIETGSKGSLTNPEVLAQVPAVSPSDFTADAYPSTLIAKAGESESILEAEMHAAETPAVQSGSGLYDLDEAYAPAAKKKFWKQSKQPQDGSVIRTTPAGAIVSFIFALASLLVFALPFGLVALITGFISLSKINSNPALYKGKGFAIVGIIIGVIAVVVGAIAISTAV
jgi:hypothetical protein